MKEQRILQKFPDQAAPSFPFKKFLSLKKIFIPILIVLVGIVSGWFLSGKSLAKVGNTSLSETNSNPSEVGISDEKTFRDSAEGILEEGGTGSDGTHHLTREGGPSQNVYLTSTVIDLQSFVGKKVKVWGETISALKAGWLMDVGKVRRLE